MRRYIIRRLVQTVIALFGISLFIFVLVRVSGDPTLLMTTGTTTPEELKNIREQLGLDKSQPEQYRIFILGLFKGDLGDSLWKKRPVTSMIAEMLPNSLRLIIPSFIASMLLAFALGILAANKRDTILDNGVKLIAVMGQALPGFWFAIMAIFILSVKWQLLPPSGTGSMAHFVLPVGTLAFFILPGMMRLVRSSMLDVLDSEYIKLARIKGLSERAVIWKHALRNALIAPLTVAGMILAMLITGTVVIETVFGWPGVGRLMVESVMARDFPIIQGITLIVASLVLGINLLVDILYAYIDPQIRFMRT